MDINKIEGIKSIKPGPQNIYEIVITDTTNGEIVYQHKGYGGMACTVEELTKFTGGNIEGVHQTLGWGNPLIQFYAYERIKEFLEEHANELVDAFMDTGTLHGDKEAFRELLIKTFKKL